MHGVYVYTDTGSYHHESDYTRRRAIAPSQHVPDELRSDAVVYSRQQYCIVQRAECRPRRAVLDGLRWRSPDGADSWIDRAPSPRRLRSMRRRSSINHDRPPLAPDASISITPKPMQINPNLTSNILLLLLLLRSYVLSIPSFANHRISLSSVLPSQPASRHHHHL